MKTYISLLVLSATVVISVVLITALVAFALKERQVMAQEAERRKAYEKILEGLSTGPIQISADYSSTYIVGSPLIFGGSHSPLLEHQIVWDQIRDSGVTSVRQDFWPENALPKNISIEDYLQNRNDVQDPKTWNQAEIKKINDTYKNAKQRGMSTIGIVSYSPAWLNHSNTIYGVPKNWVVYKDIVKKSYLIHRESLDYLEIWNEPSLDFFLDLKGSNLSREEAYKQIFKYAVEAIREVDREKNDGKRVKIGGAVSHRPTDINVLEVILKDPELKKELDFISYHNYEGEHLKEPSDFFIRELMKEYNVQNLPVFVTEWNYYPQWDQISPYHTEVAAIPFTGNKFINYLKMGIYGANYHTLEPINQKRPNNGYGTYGFYRWNNGQPQLLPQSASWRLLSKKMGLGNGPSQIYSIYHEASEEQVTTEEINAVGFKNNAGQYGITIVNLTKNTQLVKLHINSSGIKYFAKAQLYYASAQNDATKPEYEGTVKVINGNLSFVLTLPAESVAGAIFTSEHEWFENLPLPIDRILP